MRVTKKRILSMFLIVLFVFSTFDILANAAGKAQISFQTVRNSGVKYEPSSSYATGEKIYMPISFSGINDTHVGGFACEITYNSDVLEFSNDTWSAVDDDDAVFYKYSKNGTVTLLWDTVSKGTFFDGAVFYIVFNIMDDITDNQELVFGLKIQDFYELSNEYPNISYDIVTTTVQAQIVVEDIPDTVIQIFNKLAQVTATNESLENIVAAETTWETLTAQQQKLFKNRYEEAYSWFSTARTRYNIAMNQASIDEINQQVEDYKKTFADVLELTPDTVSLSYTDRLQAAIKAYEILPTSVTTRLGKNVSNLIQELEERIEDLEDATEEAASYIKDYEAYADITEEMLNEDYTTFSTQIDEAMMMYSILSEDAKLMVSELYQQLATLQEISNQIAQKNEKLAVIREEVNAYQQKWLKIFTLNVGNVSLADRTAIEMAIADYGKLSQGAQEALSSRITALRNLITKIATMEDAGAAGGDVTTDDSSETVIQTQTKEKIVETEVLVKVTEYLEQNIPKSIWFLLNLLGTAVFTLLFPLGMTFYYKKNKNKLKEDTV